MSVSIVACPKCKALLLSDTAQCPECDHVLDAQRAEQLARRTPTEEENEVVREEQCPNCGEMVRHGLVRCWNCSAFMRRDIADVFRKMNEGPRPVIYSEAEAKLQAEAQAASGPPLETPASGPAVDVAEDVEDTDDFELSPDVAAVDAPVAEPQAVAAPEAAPPAATPPTEASPPEEPDDDFELSAGVESQAAPAPAASEPSTYAVDTPSSDETKSTEDTPSAEESAATEESPATEETATAGAGEDSEAAPVAHSEATGGDVLLQTALEEEAETEKRRAKVGQRSTAQSGEDRKSGGVIMLCPCGARIRIQERHRGRPVRCPRCSELLVVPDTMRLLVAPKELRERFEQSEKEAAAKRKKEEEIAKREDKFKRWLHDVHVHAVQPEKLKLKPGSVEKTFEPFDVGFLPDGMLVVKLLKRPVVGKAAEKKHTPVREELLTHLREGNEIKDAPVFAKFFYKAESLADLRVVQPTLSPADSMFAGVPVFGASRIAIRFSTSENEGAPEFASFTLSEFRQFVTHVVERYGMNEFGQNCGVPLTDTFTTLMCHYTDQKLEVLEHLDWYRGDPGFELQHIGWKCQGCGLPLSIDGQKKEQIGGKNAKGIAKAQCPKCTQKFGDVKLFSIEKPEGAGEQPSDESAGESESPEIENAPAETAAQT